MGFSQKKRINMSLDADVQAVADNGATFQNKLADTLRGLISQNNDRKSEISALRGDHEELKKNHEAFVTSAERENDLRRNEIKSLEEKMSKVNWIQRTVLANQKLPLLMKEPNQITRLAKLKSPTWTILPSLRTLLAKMRSLT